MIFLSHFFIIEKMINYIVQPLVVFDKSVKFRVVQSIIVFDIIDEIQFII